MLSLYFYKRPIRIECWDYEANGSHNYVGETTFTIEELEKK